MTEYKDSVSLLAGSESRIDLVCIPCSRGGKHTEADGYCSDCCEHLCDQCLKYHRRLSILNHHKLMDRYNMPMDQTGPLVKDICTERCKTHLDKVVEYFCPTHNILGCSVCVTINHNQCKDVAYIPEISADLQQSGEDKIFRQRLDELIRKSDVIIKSSKEKLDTSTYHYSKFQQDISAFRQEINTALDQLESDLKAKCDQINSLNIDTMETVSSQVRQTRNELQAISSDYKGLLSSKHYCQAFTKMKTIDISPLQDKLNEMENTSIPYFTFQHNGELLHMLKGKDGLAKLLVRNPKELTAAFVTAVKIKTKRNKKKCYIREIAPLSKDKLVITDSRNDTIKLIDIAHNKVLSELKCELFPWAVTTIGKDNVAVTVPLNKTILYLRCVESLVIDKEVSVRGDCHGIAYYEDKLIVTFCNPSKVEILNMAGDVLQRFAKDDHGNTMFIAPHCLSVHPDGSSVFVSDQGNNSLIRLSMDGKIQAIYRDNELMCPSQCVIDETGLVYLCGVDSRNIHLLTPECTKIKTIQTDANRLDAPCSIYYCGATRRLYIGLFGNDNIKIYQMNA